MTKICTLVILPWILLSVLIPRSVIGHFRGIDQLHYDFIIVGGGTAGCVLANRLTENGKFTVLVVEAGGIPPAFMNVPGLARKNHAIPELTFQYHSVPQTKAALSKNGIVKIPLGRVLGGTSSINYMVYNRGSPHDFDHWANVTGDESWKYLNMLEYFKKAETYLGEFPSDQHGSDGPITVSSQKYAPGKELFLDAGRELGYSVNDPNGPQEIGFAPIEFATREGRRVSSFVGYIQPILDTRENLKFALNATVSKVLFEGNKATGIMYTNYEEGAQLAFANKEIILSAGTFGSSALLMRSGVGPVDVLEKAGVPLIKDLPVGENLQDHPVVGLQFVLGNKLLSFNPERDLTEENFDLFEKTGSGPFTTAAGYSAQAFLVSSVAQSEGYSNWSDMGIWMTSISVTLPYLQNLNVAPWETTILIMPNLPRCKSRGSVKLDPENVDGMPLIDFNYLENSLDEQVFLEGIQETLRVFEGTKSYRNVGARYPPEAVKGCEHLAFRSEAYWKCYIRQAASGGTHSTSTCAMNSVVDSKLRVFGLEGLRVVDASVMPFITNSNLHAAIYGIAEKASQDILNDWM